MSSPLGSSTVYGCNGERGESGYGEDDLVLCGESEEDLKMMVGRFLRCVREESLQIRAR